MSEQVHSQADALDSLSSLELVSLMHAEDRRAVDAVQPALPAIAAAVDQIVEALRSGGRLHYFGAGTSGRVAELEARESPATFGVGQLVVQAHVPADGDAEDDLELGRRTAQGCSLTSRDVVIGVSASGRTRYVVGALQESRRHHAFLVGVVCTTGSELAKIADVAIEVETGPEVIAGSTRLKAGTAQKTILNMLGTAVFTRLGHTHRGRMVSVVASNDKLRSRAAGIVGELGGVDARTAAALLRSAGGNVKIAIVMARLKVSGKEATALVEKAHGNLAAIVDLVRP